MTSDEAEKDQVCRAVVEQVARTDPRDELAMLAALEHANDAVTAVHDQLGCQAVGELAQRLGCTIHDLATARGVTADEVLAAYFPATAG